MLFYIELALLFVSVPLLVYGYTKNRRNLMLIAAIMLFFTGTLSDLTRGFIDGYNNNDLGKMTVSSELE